MGRLCATFVLGTMLWTLSCASSSHIAPESIEPGSFEEYARLSQEHYEKAERTNTRKGKMNLTKQGMMQGDRCVAKNPNYAPCYFYRALNTGLYYQNRIIGYPTALTMIAADAQKVIQLDPNFEQGGGYRLLGKLYLEAPGLGLGMTAITRDLHKAAFNLGQAVQKAPEYAENHLFLAEVLVELQDKEHARQHVLETRRLMQIGSYREKDRKTWKKILRKLERELR
jgi:hypothetical protein